MKRRLLIPLLIIISLIGVEAYGADWKYIGGSEGTLAGGLELSYYDAGSVKYKPTGNVEYLLKTIAESEFENIMQKYQKPIIEKTTEKVSRGYSPPYLLTDPGISRTDYMNIVAWEEIARYSTKSSLMALFEMNCKDNKFRLLSAVTYKDDGGIKSRANIENWDYIPTQSNGGRLKKILCK